jgi:NTE family protein
MTIRALVLSGGGGRGAFHAGVYKYLCEQNKVGVDDEHKDSWIPDVVVGTSIGAVNGAAIVQGIKPQALERFWLSLQESDVQGLPPGMGWLARRVANMILRHAIGVKLPHVKEDASLSPKAADSWPPLPIMPRWLSSRLIGRWSNLLDTGPLYRTLIDRLGLDEDELAAAERTLLINATNVRTGEGVIFSNHEIIDAETGQPRHNLRSPITIKRIIASCSIPMVYPWTKDNDGEVYWDGAIVTNTPLGSAFDAVRDHPVDEPMEAIIVMMTPWWEKEEDAPRHEQLPQDFGEAMTWTLDWALLASFRSDLKSTRSRNKLSAMQEEGKAKRYRYVDDVIIAPQDFMPVQRIIDYDEPASRELIKMGYEAAERVFKDKFGN